MQSKKLSLANVQGKLSRAEMKNVMAGTGAGKCNSSCSGKCELTGCGTGAEGTCSMGNGVCSCGGVC